MDSEVSSATRLAKRMKKIDFAGGSSIVQLAGVLLAVGIWYYGYRDSTSPLKPHGNGDALIIWLILGLVPMVTLILIGGKMAIRHVCDQCGNSLTNKAVKICPTCHAGFE